MRVSRSAWRRRGRLLSGLAAPVLLSLTRQAPCAQPGPLPPPAAVAAPAAPQVFDLAAARQTAAANQPAVAAARASLAAAQLKSAALNKGGLQVLLARDLPVRRRQAALGLTIAAAGVDQAECDARAAATYSYLAALYAQEQQRTADRIRNRLTDLKRLADAAVQEKRPDVSQEQADLADSYLNVVEGRKQEAIQGYERAVAALREALGLGPDCPLAITGAELPDFSTEANPDLKVERDVIVGLALSRRGEVIQATTAEQVFCLEVSAQGRLLFPPARTFASGGDLHATPLPATEFAPEYRPGAVGPEMPVTLPGNRAERREIAGAYHDRAGAVAEKTRNLIGLQAEDAYRRWKQYNDEYPKLEAAADKFKSYSENLSDKFNPKKAGYPTLDDLYFAGLRASQVRIDATQAKFRLAAALADLERVTGGGFDAGLDVPAPKHDQPKPK